MSFGADNKVSRLGMIHNNHLGYLDLRQELITLLLWSYVDW
jgi:hypothetical protein